MQDADRLDAIGAIGVARAFATGAKFNEVIHDPDVAVPEYIFAKEYVAAKGTHGRTVINHFYEKLLLLKDRMNTQARRRIAEERHAFMEQFLKRFYDEWDVRS